MSKKVFLTECSDLSQVQVLKSFLEAQGYHPQVRDEKTRGVAPHLSQLLGKLIIEVPEHEFLGASQLLESIESESAPTIRPDESLAFTYSQNLAKKAMWNAILGVILIPLLCNFYSMILGYRVLTMEKPLSPVSRNRLLWAILFNTMAFYIWLMIGPKYFKDFLN